MTNKVFTTAKEKRMKLMNLIFLAPMIVAAENVKPPSTPPQPVEVSSAASAIAAPVAAAVATQGQSSNTSTSTYNSTYVENSPDNNVSGSVNGANNNDVTNSSNISNGASSGGNTLATEFRMPRQAPAVATAPAPIVGCGASGSAGGSNSGGAAILGFAWTTRECQGWTLASAYAALGDRVTACRVLNAQNTARRAKRRGVTLPDCGALLIAPTEPVPVIIPPVDLSGYVRKEELNEVTDRITRAMVSK